MLHANAHTADTPFVARACASKDLAEYYTRDRKHRQGLCLSVKRGLGLGDSPRNNSRQVVGCENLSNPLLDSNGVGQQF